MPNNLEDLKTVLDRAHAQAATGKGNNRHANGEDQFIDQLIGKIPSMVGLGFNRGQAIKKIVESQRLQKDHAINELLGAINYIASVILVLESEKDNG